MAYEDLLKDTSVSYEDGNYFIVTLTDLVPGESYPVQLKWTYKDKTANTNWSAVNLLSIPVPVDPNRPKFSETDLSYFQGILTVTWSGKDYTDIDYLNFLDRIDVYVASDNDPGLFTVRGSIKTSGGKLEIPVEPNTYYVKLKAVNKDGLESIFSTNTYSIIAKADAPSAVSSVVPSWVGTDFNILFTSDPSSLANKYLSYYKVTLISGIKTRTFNLTPISGSSQLFSLSLDQNRAAYGVPKTSFSGSITSIDVYGNSSSATSFSDTAYVNSLDPPVISLTAIGQGYSVSYTTPSALEYDHIEVEEVESVSGTDPVSGYSMIFSGVSNPATIIRSNQNKRWVKARFYDNIGTASSYSTASSVTPVTPVVIDTTGPSAPASGTATAGIDNSAGATIGFNAYIDIAWSAVSDSTLRGYRIRFRENGTSNSYSYVDSPGTGITHRLNGLSIGTTYQIAVASYDEFNNTSSSYTSLGTAIASGTPFIGKNVTTVGYFGASATGDTGTFKFGYGVQDSGGTKRGLTFNANNYWYIDSAQSALFKLGGDTNNYIQWDGASFIVQGDIRAKSGNFSGNIEIKSGGSLYSGTIVSGSLSGAGYILNNTGLTFNSSSVNGITTIDATTGRLTTKLATIADWSIDTNTISKTVSSGTITLDAANANIRATATASSYRVVMQAPTTNASSDIVLYAGSSTPSSAPFRVQADGTVTMSSATITGYATQTSLDSTNTTVSGKIAASQVKDNIGGTGVTTISGGVVTTGIIKSGSYSGVTDGSTYSTAGTAFNLDLGTITSQNFRINTSGSAFFNGGVVATSFSLSSTGGDYWSITPGSTSSGFRFGGSTGISYSGSGNVTIGTNVTIGGDITLNANNYWKQSDNSFRLGGSSGISYSGSGNITIGSSGNNVTINTSTGAVSIAGTLTAGAVSTTALSISSTGAITTTSGNFGVTSGGILSVSGANISGDITIGTDYWKSSNNHFQLGGTSGISYSGSGNVTIGTGVVVDGNISGASGIFTGSLSGATITGGLIETSSTGQRITINETANRINFYPTTASAPATLGMGGTVFRITSPYSSGQSSSNIDMYGGSSTSYIDLQGDQITMGNLSTSGVTVTGSIGTNVLTGTATATTSGAYMGNSGYLLARRSGGTPIYSHRTTDSSGVVVQFYYSGSNGGAITGSSSVAPSFTGTSDYRAKKNIQDYSGAVNLIKQTKPKSFIMKNDELEQIQIGFIAHEFAEVFPQFVFGEKDAVDEEGSPEYQSMSTTNLVPYLMAAIKELSERLDALEG